MGVVIFWNQKSQVQVLSVTVKCLSDCHAEETIDFFCVIRIKKLVRNNEELFYLTSKELTKCLPEWVGFPPQQMLEQKRHGRPSCLVKHIPPVTERGPGVLWRPSGLGCSYTLIACVVSRFLSQIYKCLE